MNNKEDDDIEQETSEMQFEEYALKLNASDFLQADQSPKRNHKDENLPALSQELFLLVKELGPMANQENIQSPFMRCRRSWFIFIVMEVYLEKMMERLISGENRNIFRIILCTDIICLTKWRRTQERISLLCWFFRNKYVRPSFSVTFRTQLPLLDNNIVPDGFFNLHIQDWYREDKFWKTDIQYSFCLWIPWSRIMRILKRSTWMNRAMHSRCIKHGKNIRRRCIGATSILFWKKIEVLSNTIKRHHFSRKISS